MAIKKSDLYSRLWKSCDELRGGMDSSQYKDYVLTLLFLKYVSDKAKTGEGSLIEVPQGCSFDDLAALKRDKEIGEKTDKIIAQLANANDLRGVIDVTSFNDDAKLGKGNAMVDTLSKLIAIFEGLDFGANRANGDDVLGDAYEYLMRHFATESGKSKGQFYTPPEVSRILAKVVGINESAELNQTIYDPTCGSGSLLLKAADQAPKGLTIYGQEKDLATWALATMNMVLHGNETASLEHGDVISSPGFADGSHLKKHDFVVANPPFSTKAWSNGILPDEDQYKRFELGIPPDKNGDYAFLLHSIKSLKSTGKAAVIMPHGVLFRGGAEETIRRKLLQAGLIKGVIGLPANLFYGTGIPACIVVIDKEGAADRDSVFLIDSSEGFKKDGAKNRLREQDIHKTVDVFESQTEVEGFSRLVPLDEIASEANDFNLNLSRYIDSSEPEDLQNLNAHLNGGIPEYDLELLSDYWAAFPSLRAELFEEGRPGYSKAKVSADEVQGTIDANPDVQAFSTAVEEKVAEWWASHQEELEGIDKDSLPAPIIESLSEDLLKRFLGFPLLDPYDVYEQLMTYWAESMQDDIYLVSAEGWFDAAQPRGPREIGKTGSDKPKYEDPGLSFGSGKSASKYKMDLLPPEVIVEQFFADEGQKLGELALKHDQANQAAEDYLSEHAVEDGLLEEVLYGGKVTKQALTDRIKEIKDQPAYEDELKALNAYQQLLNTEAAAKKAAKAAEVTLGEKTVAKYAEVDAAEIEELVMQAKWKAAVGERIGDVVLSLMRGLGSRVAHLETRYARTITDIDRQLQEISQRVSVHLAFMEGSTE